LPTTPPVPNMSLSQQDIERIAHLARLQLPPEQREPMRARLNGFFQLVEQMQAVDTRGVEPLAHPAALIEQVALRLRDDIVSEPNQRQANQRSAPAVDGGLFLVPKVIE
jgi:aspartyl-tRNA(Asn)/glutamyl-tRNA(Gln) amidotransferase subunit C